MTELRERIIQAIQASGVLVYRNEWKPIADAVIAELGLRQEWGIKERDEPEPGWLGDTREELTGKVRPGEQLMHRHVTDWKADDE